MSKDLIASNNAKKTKPVRDRIVALSFVEMFLMGGVLLFSVMSSPAPLVGLLVAIWAGFSMMFMISRMMNVPTRMLNVTGHYISMTVPPVVGGALVAFAMLFWNPAVTPMLVGYMAISLLGMSHIARKAKRG